MEYNMKFSHESNGTKVELETQEVTLPAILEEFENFLRGCGFSFDGNIEVVYDEVE